MIPRFADPEDDATPLRLIEQADVQEALDALDEAERDWAITQGFSGALGEYVLIPDRSGGVVEALVGWGDVAARAKRRFAIAEFAAKAPAGAWRIESPLSEEDAEEAALGWLLSAYRFDRYKKAKAQQATLTAPEGVDPERTEAIAAAAYLARDLINTPTNDMGPEALEAAARALAATHQAEIEVISGDELLAENFPMIHAVGRAGPQAPRLIDMTWGEKDAPKITLVGKGVCFDTGGLNLKPAAGMRFMKKDLGGAANVLALAQMIMARALPVCLRVLIPAVENSVSATAFRPGDILTARNGLTVEIGNTDAEGRLVLADALTYASEGEPALILDMATLTGAARVALGPDLPPYFTDDEVLSQDIAAAAAKTRDPLWRLPLWAPYEQDLNSAVADLDNAPPGGFAGAITAALFLKRFVAPGVPWAHFDIFGWTPASKPGRPKGGECMAARACFEMLEARYGK